MTEPAFPPLTQRYLSSLIDGVLMVFLVVAVTVALEGQGKGLRILRLSLVFGALLIYEPLLTSKAATVGQLVTGIRVRQLSDPGARISIGRAYLRSFVKVLLGWYSFLAMGFNKQRRAVHDFAARSVVLNAAGLP